MVLTTSIKGASCKSSQTKARMASAEAFCWIWAGRDKLVSPACCQIISIGSLASKTLSFSLSIQQYVLIFALQTLVFIAALVFKGNLANLLQNKIHRAQLKREQSFNEMMVLASDSLFPNN